METMIGFIFAVALSLIALVPIGHVMLDTDDTFTGWRDYDFGDTVYILWPKHGHYQQDFEPFSGEPVGSLSEKQKGTLCEVREFTYVSENDIATRAHVVKSDMGYIYEVDANIYQDRDEAEEAMEEHNRGVVKDNISENAREIRDLHSRLGELEDVVSNLHMKLENDNDE